MKVLFMVNGSRTSSAGERATALSKRFPQEWAVRRVYRPTVKWQGIPAFALAARRFRPDVVYVVDTAYTGVLAAFLTARVSAFKWLVDTGDATSELALSNGSYNRLQLALIRWIEKLALYRSDCVVVRGSYHRQLLCERGIKDVEFIPDGVEVEFISKSSSLLTDKGCRKGELVLGVIGSLVWSQRHQMCYGWDIVEALALLRDLPVSGLIVGDGDGRPRLEQRAHALGVSDRIMFTGHKEGADMIACLERMDICISTQSNDVVGNVRTTGKLPLYLAAGKCVVATDVGEARRVLPGIGYLLPYERVKDANHPERLADLVRKFATGSADLDLGKPQRRDVVAREFDYEVLGKRAADLCLRLTSAGPTHDS